MYRSFTWAFLASLAAVAGLSAAEPTQKERIARLIAELGSDRYEIRKAATKELDDLGAAALDDLKRAADDSDDEIRYRALFLAQSIAKRLETERLLTPSHIRLVCVDMPVPDAVAQLAKKSGYNVQLDGDKTKLAAKRVTFDTGDTTFWDALRQLCDNASLVEKHNEQQPTALTSRQRMIQRRLILRGGGMIAYGQQAGAADSTIHLREGKSDNAALCQTNAVRIRAYPVAPIATALSSEREVTCTLELSVEPKIQLQRIFAAQIQSAEDEKGLKLTYLPAPEPTFANAYEMMAAVQGIGVPGQYSNHQAVRFRLRDASAKQVARLKGSILLEIIAPPAPLVAAQDILKAEGKTFSSENGHHLKIAQVKRDADQLILKVNLETPLDAMNPWGGAVLINQAQKGQVIREDSTGLQLEDAKGKRIAATSVQNLAWPVFNGRSSTNEYQLTYRLAKDQEAARLVLTGRRPAVLDVPFELKDLPLSR